jgi:hypothetical protein
MTINDLTPEEKEYAAAIFCHSCGHINAAHTENDVLCGICTSCDDMQNAYGWQSPCPLYIERMEKME